MNTETKRMLISAGSLLGLLALLGAAPSYNSLVQRVEHDGLTLDFSRAVRADFSNNADGGMLQGPPDASWWVTHDAGWIGTAVTPAIDGGCLAADANSCTPVTPAIDGGPGSCCAYPADAGLMGPPVLPSTTMNYECFATGNDVCFRSGSRSASCQLTGYLVAGAGESVPMMFSSQNVYGVCASGTSCSMECVPVVFNVASGR